MNMNIKYYDNEEEQEQLKLDTKDYKIISEHIKGICDTFEVFHFFIKKEDEFNFKEEEEKNLIIDFMFKKKRENLETTDFICIWMKKYVYLNLYIIMNLNHLRIIKQIKK